VGLQVNPLVGRDIPDNHLGQANIRHLELALVQVLLQTAIIQINAASQITDGQLGAISFPGHRRDRVVVGYFLGVRFFEKAFARGKKFNGAWKLLFFRRKKFS